MADRLWWVPTPPKMDSFQAEVSCDQSLVASGYGNYRAVFSDAGAHSWASVRAAADAGNQRFLCERQGGNHYSAVVPVGFDRVDLGGVENGNPSRVE